MISLINIEASSQPMWLIEEKARIFRNEVWLIPPKAPNTADKIILLYSNNSKEAELNRHTNKKRGAIFWIVIIIEICGHIKPFITWGNQKWKGAAPNFNKSAEHSIEYAKFQLFNLNNTEKIIIDDPRAWIKKYFKAASEEYWLFFLIIIGIKDIKFNSRPIQAPNQDTDLIEIKVPVSRVATKVIFEKEK